MTVEIIYVAWDGTRYDHQKDCETYENQCASAFYSFCKNYHFYDKEMKEQTCDSISLKEIYNWIYEQYNECEYVKVDKTINPKYLDYIIDIDGIELPEEPGLYYYAHGWKLKEE